MKYSTGVRVDEHNRVVIGVAELNGEYEVKRHARANLSVAQALALAAKLINAANAVMEQDLAEKEAAS